MSFDLTFIGNATVLLRWGPFTVLTDPNFLHAGQRVHLGYGLFSERLLEPAMQVDELPPLDAVVLSHLHGDHWDRIAQRGLDRSLPIITTPHASRRLQGVQGFRRAVGLDTWESHTVVKEQSTLSVTALPGIHSPRPISRLLPPVMGSLLELGDTTGDVAHRVYLTGDTLMFDGVAEIARRCPDLDLAVVHLGGTTLPGGLVVTMDGRQGADLLETVRPKRAVPVHVDDYSVMKSPLTAFTGEMARRGLSEMVHVVARGETASFG
ncbi:MAG TPA: MBL fold metallo-hydrolase [Nocardioidaceae bacterium]|nr:MBL fold metallo-hydrolase [Nocardioidaceae bacterium]